MIVTLVAEAKLSRAYVLDFRNRKNFSRFYTVNGEKWIRNVSMTLQLHSFHFFKDLSSWKSCAKVPTGNIPAVSLFVQSVWM